MHDKPKFIEGKPSGFRSLLGYRITTWSEGYAEIDLTLDERHMNGLSIVHGGVYATLLDAAQGHAATWCSLKGHTRICVTISLTTSFLSPARTGIVRAVGRLVGNENRIATCHGEMFDEAGTLLAAAQASFRYMPGSERVEGVPRTGPVVAPV